MARCKPRGFTLLELLLALGLSVLVMSIIVGLVGMYASNFTTRGEDIRRVALARAILNMIADDLRSTVTKQEYDTKVLEQMLMGSGGSSAGGSSAGGSSAGGSSAGGSPAQSGGQNNSGQSQNGQRGTNTSGPTNNAATPNTSPGGGSATPNRLTGPGNSKPSTGAFGQASGGGQSGQTGQSAQSGQAGAQASQPTDDAAATDATSTESTALPLGVYGSATNLTIDISRIPRLDEYNAQQNSILNGTLSDLPGDIKSVSYFVQMPSTVGVNDSMSQVSSTPTGVNGAAGLVRRAIDRAVLDNAEATGQSNQLSRTGELVAPEVLALEFSYYDGTQWTTTWDSSTQGLPWLVDITLAMQSKSGEKNGAIPPGISLSTMPFDERSRLGIEIYNLMVTIPGAQLQSTSSGSTDSTGSGTGTDSGMSSVGL